MNPFPSPQNQLLGRLPREAREQLAPHLERARYERRQVVHDGHRPVEHVLFPTTCVASLIQTMEDGAMAEAGVIGAEGMTDVLFPLGGVRPLGRVIIQSPGEGLRIEAARLRRFVAEWPAALPAMQRFVQGFLHQLVQSAGCNQFHSSTQRCARWLLAVHERAVADELAVTHEFLSEMLGVRRATVTQAIVRLTEMGAVQARRGRIAILDRIALERAACECYRAVRLRTQAALAPRLR